MRLTTLVLLLLASLLAGITNGNGDGNDEPNDPCTIGCGVHCDSMEEANCLYVNGNPTVCSEATSRKECMDSCVEKCQCRHLADKECDRKRRICTDSTQECDSASARCKGDSDKAECVYKAGVLTLLAETNDLPGPEEQGITP